MEIHNIVEDLVAETVRDIFQDEERTHRSGFCTCPQCRMDVVCYVLNRLKPEYIVSGRGLAYASSEYQDKVQRQADAVSLANEGWKRINQAKRPHFDHKQGKSSVVFPQPPVFNFPTIIGRIFNGTTFEPMNGIQILLTCEGKAVKMIDPNWQNPCSLFSTTGGTFIFWPMAEKADSQGESRLVEFSLTAKAEGFGNFSHFFSVRVNAEGAVQEQFSLQRQYTLPDLMMFPLSPESDQDQ
jgi:competence protein ComFB